jgi:hypothetical protein
MGRYTWNRHCVEQTCNVAVYDRRNDMPIAAPPLNARTYHPVLVLVRCRFSACMHALATYQAAPPPMVTNSQWKQLITGNASASASTSATRCPSDAAVIAVQSRGRVARRISKSRLGPTGSVRCTPALGPGKGANEANQIGRWGRKRPV